MLSWLQASVTLTVNGSSIFRVLFLQQSIYRVCPKYQHLLSLSHLHPRPDRSNDGHSHADRDRKKAASHKGRNGIRPPCQPLKAWGYPHRSSHIYMEGRTARERKRLFRSRPALQDVIHNRLGGFGSLCVFWQFPFCSNHLVSLFRSSRQGKGLAGSNNPVKPARVCPWSHNRSRGEKVQKWMGFRNPWITR